MGPAIAKCLLVIAVAGAFGIAAAAAAAQEAEPQCPKPNPSYTGPCGPTFVQPSWGDAAGWTDASKYSTIQLADVNGDGRAELLGRDDQGIEIWRFDTDLGQWRPQVDARALPQVLSAFRSPLPEETNLTWLSPQYYSTIQAANVDGEPGDEVLARFPEGMRIYHYVPPAGGRAIDGGAWVRRDVQKPFSDAQGWTNPSLYRTIQTADVVPDDQEGPREELISRTPDGIVVYHMRGGQWVKQPTVQAGANDDGGQLAQYFDDIVTGRPLPDSSQMIVTRNRYGVHTSQLLDNAWYALDESRTLHPFADAVAPGQREAEDCPFTAQTSDCFGSSPSYYETLQLADVDGNPGDELLARGIGGLHVRTFRAPMPVGGFSWDAASVPTLTALAGPASMSEHVYGTIQTANLDGTGGREVLALGPDGVRAWSYQGGAWIELESSTPLALQGETWEQASTFSTLQAGDVDGDGRDEVIARGPFGIRTWFYNRRGTGGWESYLPHGYPAFSGGQAAAFAALTSLAKGNGVLAQGASSVRDVWTGENAPKEDTLARLESGVVSLAKCSDPIPGDPPSYQSCTPTAPSGYDATDWTAVVNEVLAEISAAREVVTHFADLNDLRQALLTTQNAELPSIGADLRLQAAEADEVVFEANEFTENVLRIVGALAGLVPEAGEVAAAGLEIAAESVGMVGSATPSFTKSVDTTYAGVLRHFAESVDDLNKAQAVLSQEVRADYGLTMLVAQLRGRGTWKPDAIGLRSVANRAFVLWTYQSLMPALYTRFQITNCTPPGFGGFGGCVAPGGTSRGVIGNPNGPDFTIFGPSPVNNLTLSGTPCSSYDNSCAYTALPGELNDKLFAPLTDTCDYKPGTAATVWTFKCSLGVNEKTSVDPTLGPRNGWTFFTWTGAPVTQGHNPAAVRVGARSNVSLDATLQVPRALDPRRIRVRADRVLFEPGGRGELVRPRPPGAQTSAAASRRAVTVRVRRRRGRQLAFRIRVPRARVHLPHRCQELPTGVAGDLEPFRLHSRLRLSDGRRTRTVTLHHSWRCVRHRSGHVRHLRSVRPEGPPRARAGLGLALRAPATLRPGTRALYRIVVTNRRRKPRGRNRTSLWHVRVLANAPRQGIVRRIREVRRRRSKTLSVRVRVPRSASGRFCVTAVAMADRAKPVRGRACAPVDGP